MTPELEYLTTEGAARLLGVSNQRVTQLIRAGLLEASKVAGIWLISRKSVEERARSVRSRGGRPRRGHAAHEARFVLKNREYDVVELIYDSRTAKFSWMGEVLDAGRAPLGVLAGSVEPSLAAFNLWWEGRGIPHEREGVANLLRALAVDVPEQLVTRNLGLSLSDQYWVCPDGSGLTWDDINFFAHDFSEVSEHIAPYVPRASSGGAHPDNTTNGNLGKTWIVRDGVRMLLKEGRNLNQEPYNEVVATALHRRLLSTGDYVPYELAEHDGRTVSACPNFLSSEEEYIPAYYVDLLLEPNAHQNDYEHYLACCKKLGVENAQLALWKTIVCDDILANPDRHWRNFGIVRNVETLTCRPAPVFDSGEGLWCNTSLADLKRGEFGFTSKQFFPGPAQQLLLVEDLTWFEAEALDGFVDEAMDILSANEMLEERLPSVRRSLERRVERMRDLREWA